MTTLSKILDKYGITGLSCQKESGKPLSANNQSRKEFIAFCKQNGFTRVGALNAFKVGEDVYAFSMPSGKPECRQFSEHYAGLVCKMPSGKIEWFSKEQLLIGGLTRVGADGTKYFNAVLK